MPVDFRRVPGIIKRQAMEFALQPLSLKPRQLMTLDSIVLRSHTPDNDPDEDGQTQNTGSVPVMIEILCAWNRAG